MAYWISAEKLHIPNISMNFHTNIPKFQMPFKNVAEIPNKE